MCSASPFPVPARQPLIPAGNVDRTGSARMTMFMGDHHPMCLRLSGTRIKSAGINSLASSPLSSSGSRAGGNTRSSYSLHAVVPLINIFFCPLLALRILRISPGPTAQYMPGRQTNFASNIPKRDRVHRRSSARACAFRFVSTIRPKVKS